MTQRKPQQKILTCWRIQLAIGMFIPAFLNALLFPFAQRTWIWLTCGWLAVFFALYLFYLPARYRHLSFSITGTRIIRTSGVFSPRTRSLPLQNVQFTVVTRGPLQRLFGLATLMVAAAGGRITLPGLIFEDAQALAEILLDNPK